MASSSRVRRVRSSAVIVAFIATVATVLVGGAVADAATSVGSASIAVSPPVAGASGVRYTVGFTNTAALAPNNTVSLNAPAGTVFSNLCAIAVWDRTEDPDKQVGGSCSSGWGTNVVEVPVWYDVAAGHDLEVIVDDVTNTTSTGSQSLAVSTTSDVTPVNVAFSLGSGSVVVSGVGLVVSPPVAGASGVRYTVGFTNTNALNANYSKIRLSAPAGTVFSNSCAIAVWDRTEDPDKQVSWSCASSGGGTNEITVPVYYDVPAGHDLEVIVDDVTNTTSTGSQSLAVSTTSDVTPVNVAFSLGSGSVVVSGVGLVVSPPVAGASGVRYTVGFTNTNALNASYSRIRLSAPAGTVFSNNCAIAVWDRTDDTDIQVGSSCSSGWGTNVVEVRVWSDVAAGRDLEVIVDDVTNTTSTGSQSLAVSTTSDVTPVTTGFSLGSGSVSISGAGVVVSPEVAGASGVRYTVGFTNTNALNANYSKIRLSAPAGTVFSNGCAIAVWDRTEDPDKQVGGSCSSGWGTNVVEVPVWYDVAAGHDLEVIVDDVTNTTSTGSQSLAVSTTSDVTPVNVAFSLGSGSVVVSGVGLVVSPPVAGASGVRYTVGFTNTNALNANYSKIRLSAPAGTVFSNNCAIAVWDRTDDTDIQVGSSCSSGWGTNVVEVRVWSDVAAGRDLEVIVDDVTNTTSTGSQSLAVSTTSDTTPVTTGFNLGAGPTAVTNVGVHLDNTLPEATGVTYTAVFTNTNVLNANYSKITVSGPAGTVFSPNCDIQIWDTTPEPDTQVGWACPTNGGTNEITVPVYYDVPAGHAMKVVIPSSTNASGSGSQTIGVRTTSDKALATATYTLGLGVDTTSLPSAVSGEAYSTTLSATGGTAPYTWALVGGTLPEGLSLNPTTGVISGTPAENAGGVYQNLVFRVTDATSKTSDSIPLTLNVGMAPSIWTASSATFAPGIANGFQVYATGVPTPTFSLSGTLPSGVTFTDNGNGTATLAGTPPVGSGGDYPLVITASNGISPDSVQDFNLKVAKSATTSWVTGSPNPSKVGQTVTFTATVSGSGATPTGSVEFFDGATSLGTRTLDGFGQASLETSALGLGDHSITVVYAGDDSFLGSTSSVFTQTVAEGGATSTSLGSSVNPSVFGQVVSFTASVSGEGGVPSGTVTFFEGASVLASVALDSAGQAVFATSSLAVGSHSVTAVYGGDGVYATSSSTPLTQVVSKAASSTGLVSSLNPSGAGASVTFTATVSAVAPGSGVPTGSVEFFDGETSLGTRPVDSSGQAGLSTDELSVGSHDVTAVYSGSTSFEVSTSSVLVQVVNPSPLVATETALVSSVNPSVFGQSVMFTASVSGEGGVPSGMVTFFDGVTQIGAGVLDASGQASVSTSVLAVGSHQVTAVYGGDTTFNPSSSTALDQVVAKAATSTELTSSVNPSGAGASVTFTATVTATAPGAGLPAGSVEFFDGETSLGTVSLDGFGQAALSTAALSAGTHQITATYSGSPSFAGSTATLDQVVNQTSLVETSTSLVSSVNPSVFGQVVSFTASVSGEGGVPSGTVTFFEGASVLASVALDSAGQAVFATSSLAVGSHSVTAVYGGDGVYATSSSTPLTQVVSKAASSTGLVSSLNPSGAGASVTFTATVSAVAPGSGVPTGSVEFFDGETSLGTRPVDSSGQAGLSTDELSVGSHDVTAVYSGSTSFEVSTSSLLVQVVNPSPLVATETALVSSVNPSVFGQSVMFTASVSGEGGVPSGMVTFFDGVTQIGAGVLDASGQASVSTSTLAVGSHQVTAVYGGDTTFNPSSSTALDQVVDETSPTGTSTSVASSVNPSAFGQAVTFTATVTSSDPEAGTPTGTVEFRDGTTVLGTATLDENGVATLETASLAVGGHSITVAYSGDDGFGPSTSMVLEQDVNPAGTATTVSSSDNPSTVGQSVTFTAEVTVVAPGSGKPTGTVELRDGSTSLGTATLDGTGKATFETSALTVGVHPITVIYVGDGSYGSSTSTPLDQVVEPEPLVATTTNVTSSLNPSQVGQSVTFTATVDGEEGTPTGTVEFRDGAAVLGTGTVGEDGTATLVTDALAVGTHQVTAIYSGDGTFAGSSSDALAQVVEDSQTCTPLDSVRSVRGTGRLASGGSLSLSLNRVRFPFLRPFWSGSVTYRDIRSRAMVVAAVLTRNDVVQPLADECNGARIRVDAINLFRFPWRTGRLDLSIADRSPDSPDTVDLTFPRIPSVSSTVTRGGFTVR